LTNQNYLEDVFTFKGTENQLSQIIKEMALSSNTSTNNIVIPKEENASHLIDISKKATLGIARNIKSISDRLRNALAAVPQYYHFSYEDIDIGIDNIEALRATLLATASQMSLATAYDVGVDDNYKPQTYTDASGNKYQFTDIDIHQDTMLNSEGFGQAKDQSSLDLAKAYLTESALILKDLDANSIREDLNESTTNSQEDIDAYQEVIDYGTKLYKVLSTGTGTFTITDEDNGEGKKEETEIAINRLFNVDTAPKTSDLGTDWAYESCPQDFNISTEDEIKKYDKRFCYPKDLSYEKKKWDYSNYCEVEPYSKIKPTSETSSVDKLITQIKVGDEIKTGEELINYLFDDNNSGVREYCGLPYSASSKAPTTTGTVIDDYISGATVCVDSNENGVLDTTDTPCAPNPTNATGQFSFGNIIVTSNLPFIMSGGTDVGTGKAFTGTLSAPAGSKVVNPLTTIVQAVVASGKSVAEAQTLVKAKLGLDANINLTTFDPIATISTGSDEEKAKAKTVFAQQSSIQVVLTTVAKTIAAAVDTKEESHVTNEAATQIAALMTATNAPDKVDVAADAETIIKETANVVITDDTAKANVVAVAANVAAQVETAASKVVETVTAATTLVSVRTAAAEVATVVETNSDALATALSAETVDTATLNANIQESTTNLIADIDAVELTTTDVFETVATEETIPVVTGAEGGN